MSVVNVVRTLSRRGGLVLLNSVHFITTCQFGVHTQPLGPNVWSRWKAYDVIRSKEVLALLTQSSHKCESHNL